MPTVQVTSQTPYPIAGVGTNYSGFTVQNSGTTRIFFGHDPSVSPSNYGNFVDPGGSITWPADSPCYCIAGDIGGQINYSPLVANLSGSASGTVSLTPGSTVGVSSVGAGTINTLASHVPVRIDTKTLVGPGVGQTVTATYGPYDASTYASMKLLLTTTAAGPLPGNSADQLSVECVFYSQALAKLIGRSMAYYDPAGYFGNQNCYGMRAVSVIGQFFFINVTYTSGAGGGDYSGVTLIVDIYGSHEELPQNQYSSFSVRNTDPSLAISSYWSLSVTPAAELDLAIGSKSGETNFILFSEGGGSSGFAYLWSYIGSQRVFWSGLAMPSTTPGISSIQNTLYLPPAPLWIGLRCTSTGVTAVAAILTQADRG